MQISYKPLWHTLLEKGMSKEDLEQWQSYQQMPLRIWERIRM